MPKKLTTEEFIEKAKLVHGNRYKYTDTIYETCKKNVTILCNIHGIFEQLGSSHLQGYGCKSCGVESRVNASKNTIEDFIKKSEEKYNRKYNYCNYIYKNVDTKSIIICPIHGEFEQTPYSHLNSKYGCNKCAIEINSDKCRKLPKELAKLKKNFSRRAKLFLRSNKNIRNRQEFTSILGCDWAEFKKYLETNSYSFKIECKDLDLDHIIPISDAVDEASFYKLCHYTNFQLLPSVYNQHIKRAKPFDKYHFENWLVETDYNKC